MSASTLQPKTLSFYRLTDRTSLTKIDEYGKLDTLSHFHYPLGDVINNRNLNKHIDWKHRFDTNGDANNPPMFVSLTHDRQWAEKEFARREARGRRPSLHEISTQNLEWMNLEFRPGAILLALVDDSEGFIIFSAEVAVQSDAVRLQHRMLDGHEWFAVEYIPASMIRKKL